jgi:hypothetical protein
VVVVQIMHRRQTTVNVFTVCFPSKTKLKVKGVHGAFNCDDCTPLNRFNFGHFHIVPGHGAGTSDAMLGDGRGLHFQA